MSDLPGMGERTVGCPASLHWSTRRIMSLLPESASFEELVQDYFLAVRGAGLMLSALDTELLTTWAWCTGSWWRRCCTRWWSTAMVVITTPMPIHTRTGAPTRTVRGTSTHTVAMRARGNPRPTVSRSAGTST